MSPSSVRKEQDTARTLKGGQRPSEARTNEAALNVGSSGSPASVAIELVAAERPTGRASP